MSTIQEDKSEGNKLIAEFMGARKRWFWFGGYHSADNVSDEPSKTHAYKQGNGPYKKANKYYQHFKWQMHPEDKSGQFDECLKYHSSWDWLMPVVEKIQSMGYFVSILGDGNLPNTRELPLNYCNIFKSDFGMKLIIEGALIPSNSKIESVWLGCSAFIRWYNANQPPLTNKSKAL